MFAKPFVRFIPPTEVKKVLNRCIIEARTEDARWHTHHDCVTRHVMSHDGPRADDRTIADCNPSFYQRVGADPNVVTDNREGRIVMMIASKEVHTYPRSSRIEDRMSRDVLARWMFSESDHCASRYRAKFADLSVPSLGVAHHVGSSADPASNQCDSVPEGHEGFDVAIRHMAAFASSHARRPAILPCPADKRHDPSAYQLFEQPQVIYLLPARCLKPITRLQRSATSSARIRHITTT